MKYFRNLVFIAFLSVASISANAQQDTHATYFNHTVEKGQSIYSIASMYGITPYEIIALNPESEKVVKVGDSLKIPQRTAQNQRGVQYHTIQSGETLYRLTTKYNVSAEAICNANPGLSPDSFRAGQVVIIPAAGSSKRDVTAKAPTATASTQNTRLSNCKDMHKVEKKETVYSISNLYGITENDLIAANPEIKGQKLKKGTFLCIPYPKKVQTVTSTQTPTNQELFEKSKKKEQRYNSVQAAVLLPFAIGSNGNSEANRMFDYYKGFLLAVDSLKHQGYSYDIYSYDTSNESIDQILARPEMKRMNIIFGPINANQTKSVADFSKKNNIRMVIPFSSKDAEVFNNPNIYQVNTPQSYLYSTVYDYFTNKFRNSNIIILDVNGSTDKAEFIQGLKPELNNKGITYKTLAVSTPLSDIINSMKISQTNIFVPSSGEASDTETVIKLLKKIKNENQAYNLALFGYPEYQAQAKNFASFYNLNTFFYASFFTDSKSYACKAFDKKMKYWYGKEQIKSIPRFGMLGFDTGYFFLRGLSLYGSGFEQNISRINANPYQSFFQFKRVNNWGGFINQKIEFINFAPDNTIKKIEF